MGQKNTAFSKQELQEYAELTYLSEKDVLRAYNGYYKIDPDKVGKGRISARIPSQRIRTNTHALRLNPFGDRICDIFSTSEAGMSFEDYLDMYSALSEAANRNVKTTYAFKIYDFDGDGLIGKEDLRQAIDRLVFDEDKHLTKSETNCIIDNILKECDNDEDGALCYPEFQQAMSKCPDFLSNFKMYL